MKRFGVLDGVKLEKIKPSKTAYPSRFLKVYLAGAEGLEPSARGFGDIVYIC